MVHKARRLKWYTRPGGKNGSICQTSEYKGGKQLEEGRSRQVVYSTKQLSDVIIQGLKQNQLYTRCI